MSLLFNTLFRFVIAFLPRGKCLFFFSPFVIFFCQAQGPWPLDKVHGRLWSGEVGQWGKGSAGWHPYFCLKPQASRGVSGFTLQFIITLTSFYFYNCLRKKLSKVLTCAWVHPRIPGPSPQMLTCQAHSQHGHPRPLPPPGQGCSATGLWKAGQWWAQDRGPPWPHGRPLACLLLWTVGWQHLGLPQGSPG